MTIYVSLISFHFTKIKLNIHQQLDQKNRIKILYRKNDGNCWWNNVKILRDIIWKMHVYFETNFFDAKIIYSCIFPREIANEMEWNKMDEMRLWYGYLFLLMFNLFIRWFRVLLRNWIKNDWNVYFSNWFFLIRTSCFELNILWIEGIWNIRSNGFIIIFVS